ncbi:MAG: carbamoyltransferase, partial [bacterium]
MNNKDTYILGISAFYHDSAACLIKNGEILFAAQEERFTRKKHDCSFPKNAVDFCLSEAGINSSDLDYIAFYDKPFVKFERLLMTYLAYAPKGLVSFLKAMPLWLKRKLWMKDFIENELGATCEILFPEHHHSHVASAFFPSPFKEAAILTADGVGEWATASYGIGTDNNIELWAEINFPHSLGLLYSAFTYYTGFKVNSGEYKLMGLAPYGEPKYVNVIQSELIDLKEDGSFKMNMKYFNYCAGLTMTNEKFHKLFGFPPRDRESDLTQDYMDIARSIQAVAEEIMLRMARHVHRQTGMKYLCLAGGVALNCVANGRILREGPFEDLWIQPAAGDAGGALGAALAVWYQYLEKPRKTDNKKDLQKSCYLGPGFDNRNIEKFLNANHINYKVCSDAELMSTVADVLIDGSVVGWFQGRMEFGPRALGNRSILGDARSPKMQSLMNLKIKFRESFRPFAPSVLKEHAHDWFDLDRQSPYMLLVAPVQKSICTPLSEDQNNGLLGIERLNWVRSQIPAVTHVDYSARIQTVAREDNPRYYALMKSFYEKTGCPVLINTSFNVRGEPIVCTPQEAYRCFTRTNMDYLIMGNYLLDKKVQKKIGEEKS